MEVFLSLIITTHKRNDWLAECLQSIFTSINSYKDKGGALKIEIVVSDDDPQQSTFDIQTWIQKFETLNVDFVYHINTQNLGDYFNRNNGITIARGKWIKFIDDDDLVYEWTVPFILDKLNTVGNANTVIFYLRDNFRHLQFPVVLKDKSEIFDFHYKHHGLFHCSLVSAVFKRDDLLQKGGFKFKRFYGDFQIFHEMASNGCFYIYPIELGWYRTHPEQESNNNRRMVRIRFNYLLYSFNYFLQSKDEDHRYMNVLLKDTFAYIKHATKRADTPLLKRAFQIRSYIKKFMSDSKGFDRNEWNKFYETEMRFSNNALGELTGKYE
jgi:glycosyltransferase involved in cell wall biosynthesis